MDIIQEVCNLLHKKKALFVQYEDCTNALSHSDMNNIEEYITNRAQMAIEIDKIDAEIKKQCADYGENGFLMDVVANRCEFASLSDELRMVFTDAQDIFAIINRISLVESVVMQRMKAERNILQDKIKASQNTPKIERYLNGLTMKPESGAYLNQKYGKV